MTTALSSFGITEEQIIRKDGTFYLTVSILSQVLKCSPQNIRKNIRLHKEEFDIGGNLKFPDGSYQLDEEQVYILCMIMRRNEIAKKFRRALAQTLKAIRKREFVHISELQAAQKQLGEITEKWVCVKQKISKQRIERYHKFRALNLTQAEAARAARIPFRSAVRLEKAKQLLALSSAPLLERSAV